MNLDSTRHRDHLVTLEKHRDTKDLLLNRPLGRHDRIPELSGHHLGQLNNKGVELEVRSLNISNADFN